MKTVNSNERGLGFRKSTGSQKYIRSLTLLLVAATLQACSTTQVAPVDNTQSLVGTTSSESTPPVALVKRTQTQEEINLLFERFNKTDRAELPKGLQAILGQMVTLPLRTSNSVAHASPATVAGVAESAEDADRAFVDDSDSYRFASRKPNLPLSGGFLNNPASQMPAQTVEEKLAASKNVKATSWETSNSRGMLSRAPASFEPVRAKIKKQAREVTEEILTSANGALHSASEVLDKGFAAIKNSVGSDERRTESRSNTPRPTESISPTPLPAPELIGDETLPRESTQDPVVEQPVAEVDTAITPEPKESVTDIKKDLQSAKTNFLSRFNSKSYSIIREGILVLALLIGFFLVSWIRMEYEQASRTR